MLGGGNIIDKMLDHVSDLVIIDKQVVITAVFSFVKSI